MSKFTNFLVYGWLTSIAFSQYSIVGSLSVDNLLILPLSALLIITIGIAPRTQTTSNWSSAWPAMLVALVYFFAHTTTFAFSDQAIWFTAYFVGRDMLYFLVPILAIRDKASRTTVYYGIITLMALGCISAAASSLGLIEFSARRYAESRIGVEFLRKSVGLFPSYGDMGILIAYAMLIAFSRNLLTITGNLGTWTLRILMMGIATVGMAGMQSRNILLTVFVAFLCFFFISRYVRTRAQHLALTTSILFAISLAAAVAALYWSPLVEAISRVGGTAEAAGTVNDRIIQYAYMWSLIKDKLLFGVDALTYQNNSLAIYLIHNLWLKELVTGGLLAFGAMAAIWMWAWGRQTRAALTKISAKHAHLHLSMLVALLVATQFYPGGTPIFWIALGIMASTIPSREFEICADPPTTESRPRYRNIESTGSRLMPQKGVPAFRSQ